MSTEKPPKDSLTWPLQGLTEAAGNFLDNWRAAEQRQSKDLDAALSAQKKERDNADTPDAFEAAFQRLRTVLGPKVEGLGSGASVASSTPNPSTPNKVSSASPAPEQSKAGPQSPPPQSKAAPLTVASPVVSQRPTPPQEVVARMTDLLCLMRPNEEAPTLSKAPTWSDLDRVSAQMRLAWVSVLSQGPTPPPSTKAWLEEWSEIVQMVAVESNAWGDPHGQPWAQWAQERAQEIAALRPWLASTTPVVSALEVPSSYHNKGLFPSAPKDVPAELQNSLQQCADFFEFAQSQQIVRWKNTPIKSAFENARSTLEQWVAPSAHAEEWKESALDRCAVMEGRMVLLSARTPDASVAPKTTKHSL